MCAIGLTLYHFRPVAGIKAFLSGSIVKWVIVVVFIIGILVMGVVRLENICITFEEGFKTCKGIKLWLPIHPYAKEHKNVGFFKVANFLTDKMAESSVFIYEGFHAITFSLYHKCKWTQDALQYREVL